jgi:hypothetical protein
LSLRSGEPVIGRIFITRQSSRARFASGPEDSVNQTGIDLFELVLTDLGVVPAHSSKKKAAEQFFHTTSF